MARGDEKNDEKKSIFKFCDFRCLHIIAHLTARKSARNDRPSSKQIYLFVAALCFAYENGTLLRCSVRLNHSSEPRHRGLVWNGIFSSCFPAKNEPSTLPQTKASGRTVLYYWSIVVTWLNGSLWLECGEWQHRWSSARGLKHACIGKQLPMHARGCSACQRTWFCLR